MGLKIFRAPFDRVAEFGTALPINRRFTMHIILQLIMLVATISHVRALPSKALGAKSILRPMSMAKEGFQVVLLRHGESTWNDENKFTGWYDCPLSAKGRKEAEAAGKLLHENNFKFDLAYTSFLQRAIRTLWYSLEETNQMHIPIKNAWQLNERYV